MTTYKTLDVEEDDGLVTLNLNRPEVHNAFNDELIDDAINLFEELEGRTDIRAMLLRSRGPNFCAGADLNWMSRMVGFSRDENIRDSSKLAKMFEIMNSAPYPVVGRIQGSAIGGGVGLVSICDIAITMAGARFGLSEVKLGILPAVISPYVISKIGESHARALFLTGERFDAARAMQIGLVHRVAEDEAGLDRFVGETIDQLRTSGPEAVRECKKLIRYVAEFPIRDAVPFTIGAIATRRASDEGQQGMKAFLTKTKAPWVQK